MSMNELETVQGGTQGALARRDPDTFARLAREARPDTNPKSAFGMLKPSPSLVPPVAILAEAVVFGLGAVKYGPFNWRATGVSARVYIDAADRHIKSWQDGEELDPESGESHLAHARACLGIILDVQASGKLIDDRPIPGTAAAFIREHTKAPVDSDPLKRTYTASEIGAAQFERLEARIFERSPGHDTTLYLGYRSIEDDPNDVMIFMAERAVAPLTSAKAPA
jgi:hypothetical protein